MDLRSAWANANAFGVQVGPDGRVIDATESVETTLGVTRELLIGSLWAAWYTPGHTPKVKRAHGADIPVRVTAGTNGTFWIENAEAQKTAEASAMYYREELRSLEYAVSHDLSEPLRGVASYLDLAIKKFDSAPPEAQEYLYHARASVTQTHHFLRDFVQYLQIDRHTQRTTTRKPVDLNVIFTDVLRSLRLLVEEAGAVVDVAPNLPTVRGEPRMLYQVFSNLTSNAIKFRDPNRRAEIRVTAKAVEGGVEISVSDNGRGIHYSKLNAIFAPFARVHKDVNGTGIGLAIVKRCVEFHGGSVRVDSEVGKGSVFTVLLTGCDLPLDAPPPPR